MLTTCANNNGNITIPLSSVLLFFDSLLTSGDRLLVRSYFSLSFGDAELLYEKEMRMIMNH